MCNEVALHIFKRQLKKKKKVPNGALQYRNFLNRVPVKLQKVVFFLEKGENSQTIKEYLLKEFGYDITEQTDQEQLGNLLFAEAILVIRAALDLRLTVGSSFFNKSPDKENVQMRDVHAKVTEATPSKQLDLSSQHKSIGTDIKEDEYMNPLKTNDRVQLNDYYSNDDVAWSYKAGSQGVVTGWESSRFLVRVRMTDHGYTLALRPQMLKLVTQSNS